MERTAYEYAKSKKPFMLGLLWENFAIVPVLLKLKIVRGSVEICQEESDVPAIERVMAYHGIDPTSFSRLSGIEQINLLNSSSSSFRPPPHQSVSDLVATFLHRVGISPRARTGFAKMQMTLDDKPVPHVQGGDPMPRITNVREGVTVRLGPTSLTIVTFLPDALSKVIEVSRVWTCHRQAMEDTDTGGEWKIRNYLVRYGSFQGNHENLNISQSVLDTDMFPRWVRMQMFDSPTDQRTWVHDHPEAEPTYVVNRNENNILELVEIQTHRV
jgi:hypothetical protein